MRLSITFTRALPMLRVIYRLICRGLAAAVPAFLYTLQSPYSGRV